MRKIPTRAVARILMISAAGMVLLCAAGVPAWGAEPQIRLTPADITALAQAAPPHRGAAMLTLNGDPTKPGVYSQRVTIPPHTRVPPHTHRDDRAVYIVSGTLYVGYGEKRDAGALKALPAGSYYTEPAATPHYTETQDEPAVLLVTGYGPSDTHIIGGRPGPASAPPKP